MNVITSLGISVKRANGEVMTEPTAPEPLAEAKVYLIQSTCNQGTVLEATLDLPVARSIDSLLFEQDQVFVVSMGYGVSRCLATKHQRGKTPRLCRFVGRYVCWECHHHNQRSVSGRVSRDHDFC